MPSDLNSAVIPPSPDFWIGMDPELRFQNPKPLELLRYWEEKRGARQMPSRADLSPVDMRGHMGDLILIDVASAPFRLKYRLIGTNITTVMERDSTGKYYDEIYSTELLSVIYERFDWIIRNKAPLRTHGQSFYPDKNFYNYETLNLPLSDDGETVNMVLGELIFHLADVR